MKEINYSEYGSGDVVVFLPGWGRTIADFAFLDNKKLGFKAVTVDLPGFGLSLEDEEVITVHEYANRIKDFLLEKKLAPKVIVGHSFGGKVAFKLAEQLDVKLLLIAPSLVKPRFSLKVFLAIKKYKLLKKFNRRPESGSKDYINASQHLKKVLVAATNTYFNKQIKKCSVTGVLFWGDKDRATPLYMAKYLNKHLVNFSLQLVEGDHFAFLNYPYQIIRIVESLL